MTDKETIQYLDKSVAILIQDVIRLNKEIEALKEIVIELQDQVSCIDTTEHRLRD